MMSRDDDVINVIELKLMKLMNDSDRVDRSVGCCEKFKSPISCNEIVLNEKYRKYLSDLGIKAFPGLPGTPTDKSKVKVDISHEIMFELKIKNKYKSMEYGGIT